MIHKLCIIYLRVYCIFYIRKIRISVQIVLLLYIYSYCTYIIYNKQVNISYIISQ